MVVVVVVVDDVGEPTVSVPAESFQATTELQPVPNSPTLSV